MNYALIVVGDLATAKPSGSKATIMEDGQHLKVAEFNQL